VGGRLFVFALAASVVTTGCDTMPASLTTDLPQAQAEAEAQKMNLYELIQHLENVHFQGWTLEKISKILGAEFTFDYTTSVLDVYAATGRFVFGDGLVIDAAEIDVGKVRKDVVRITLHIAEDSDHNFPFRKLYGIYEPETGNLAGQGEAYTTDRRSWGGKITFVSKDYYDEGESYLIEVMFSDMERFRRLKEESLAPPTYKLSLIDRVRVGLGMGL
jgi:hypothetical protein